MAIDTSKTVLLHVKFSGLGNSKKVSNSQVECDADKSLIRVSKQLLDSPELETIRSLDGEIRRYLYDSCLPFEAGIHLLPTALIETVEARLTDYQTQRRDLVSLFVSAYPRLCEDAARRLRGLYNPRDYPGREEIYNAFSMSWAYISFDAPQALAAISTDIFNREREKIAARMEEAYDEARQVLRETMAELVKHLRERLEAKTDGTAKRLHASTIDSLKDFCRTFDFRNISNDAELAGLVSQTRELLEPVRVDSLRDSTRYRQEISAELSKIETAIDASLLAVPRRRMVMKEETAEVTA
jgi:hypothetical protein